MRTGQKEHHLARLLQRFQPATNVLAALLHKPAGVFSHNREVAPLFSWFQFQKEQKNAPNHMITIIIIMDSICRTHVLQEFNSMRFAHTQSHAQHQKQLRNQAYILPLWESLSEEICQGEHNNNDNNVVLVVMRINYYYMIKMCCLLLLGVRRGYTVIPVEFWRWTFVYVFIEGG